MHNIIRQCHIITVHYYLLFDRVKLRTGDSTHAYISCMKSGFEKILNLSNHGHARDLIILLWCGVPRLIIVITNRFVHEIYLIISCTRAKYSHFRYNIYEYFIITQLFVTWKYLQCVNVLLAQFSYYYADVKFT